MWLSLKKKSDNPYNAAFRQMALNHNVRTSRMLTAIIGMVGLILVLISQYSTANNVLKYPSEYESAIKFIFFTSAICYLSFYAGNKMNEEWRLKAYKFISDFYAIIIVISSLWLTFVMQHNPSNTMSIFVLGIITVAALWIFDRMQTLIIAFFILILFDGGLHYFQTDSCKLFTNYITGTCVSVFFVCISRACFSVNYKHFLQLKKIEEDNKDLTRLNQIQTNILSVVAHDLRTPNNNVISLVNILKDPTISSSDKDEFHDMILASCTSSNEIIEDLLNIARSEFQEGKLEYLDVAVFLETVLVNYKKINNCSQQINFKTPPGKYHSRLNARKMQRVIENILSNAVKFSAADAVINVELSTEYGKNIILIADNGIGIPVDLMPHLFSRFSKAGRKGLKGEDSNGLGLSICKLLVEQQQGELSIQSKEGKGTHVKILLPAA